MLRASPAGTRPHTGPAPEELCGFIAALSCPKRFLVLDLESHVPWAWGPSVHRARLAGSIVPGGAQAAGTCPLPK